MKRFVLTILIFVVLYISLFINYVSGETSQLILDAKVLEVTEITQQEGLRIQIVQVEIIEGTYKGNVKELQIPLETVFVRSLKAGDRIKVSITFIDNEAYFQFYDFARSRNYLWLFVLFIIILVVFVGWKGFKTLIPSILLIAFLLIGIIPNLLVKGNLLVNSLIIIGVVSSITAWIRIKHKLLTIIVTLSVLTSLLIGFLVFVGFSQVSYVVPFLGSIAAIDENFYLRVLDLIFVSVIFVPAGGVINASIQIAKYLLEKFGMKSNLSIGDMLKDGMRISQKISAGELNNLIVMMIGLSVGGVFLIEKQYPEVKFWDNGWVSLQVIYAISAGLAILLITPITVFVCAGVVSLSKRNGKTKGGQRLLKMENQTKRFKYFKRHSTS